MPYKHELKVTEHWCVYICGSVLFLHTKAGNDALLHFTFGLLSIHTDIIKAKDHKILGRFYDAYLIAIILLSSLNELLNCLLYSKATLFNLGHTVLTTNAFLVLTKI